MKQYRFTTGLSNAAKRYWRARSPGKSDSGTVRFDPEDIQAAEGAWPADRDEIWAAVRNSLDAIAAERRGSDWLEASVMVNSLFRQAARDTFRQLQELKAITGESAFDDFVEKLFVVLHPHTLTHHGYKRSLGSRDSGRNWKAIAEIGAVLEDLGHEWFINSGTLLGLVRNGDFISHDDDIDLAVLLPGNDVDAVVRSWFGLRTAIRDRGMLVAWNERNQIHLKVKATCEVDVFPCWIIDGRVFIWPHTEGEIGKYDLLPLKLRSVDAASVKLPAHPDKVLELNYGPNWAIPDPAWRFDWRAALGRFADFRAAYREAKTRETAVEQADLKPDQTGHL